MAASVDFIENRLATFHPAFEASPKEYALVPERSGRQPEKEPASDIAKSCDNLGSILTKLVKQGSLPVSQRKLAGAIVSNPDYTIDDTLEVIADNAQKPGYLKTIAKPKIDIATIRATLKTYNSLLEETWKLLKDSQKLPKSTSPIWIALTCLLNLNNAVDRRDFLEYLLRIGPILKNAEDGIRLPKSATFAQHLTGLQCCFIDSLAFSIENMLFPSRKLVSILKPTSTDLGRYATEMEDHVRQLVSGTMTQGLHSIQNLLSDHLKQMESERIHHQLRIMPPVPVSYHELPEAQLTRYPYSSAPQYGTHWGIPQGQMYPWVASQGQATQWEIPKAPLYQPSIPAYQVAIPNTPDLNPTTHQPGSTPQSNQDDHYMNYINVPLIDTLEHLRCFLPEEASHVSINLLDKPEVVEWIESDRSSILCIEGYLTGATLNWTSEFSLDVIQAAQSRGYAVLYHFCRLLPAVNERLMGDKEGILANTTILKAFLCSVRNQCSKHVKYGSKLPKENLEVENIVKLDHLATMKLFEACLKALKFGTILYIVVDDVHLLEEWTKNRDITQTWLHELSEAALQENIVTKILFTSCSATDEPTGIFGRWLSEESALENENGQNVAGPSAKDTAATSKATLQQKVLHIVKDKKTDSSQASARLLLSYYAVPVPRQSKGSDSKGKQAIKATSPEESI